MLDPLGEAELGEPLEGPVEAAPQPGARAEPQRAGELVGRHVGGLLVGPQHREPAKDRDAARADHRPPALLDVRVGQVEAEAADLGVGVGEGLELELCVHAH